MISDPEGTVLALFRRILPDRRLHHGAAGVFDGPRAAADSAVLLAVALSMAILPIMWDTIYPRGLQQAAPPISV